MDDRRIMSAARPSTTGRSGPVVLRPGIAQPVLGYGLSVPALAAGLAFTWLAHSGKNAPLPPAGDWHALVNRLGAGLVSAVLAWGFYQLGSQQVVLGDEVMRILSIGTEWRVRRDEVARVVLSPAALTIVLADGRKIRPFMFLSTPSGMVMLSVGWFRNAMSRTAIAEAIMQWSQAVPGGFGDDRPGAGAAPRVRRFGLRASCLLLPAVAAIVALEAVLVTAFLR
jgi:hypothetical protein